MRSQIQRELDMAEEYVLNKLFGDYTNPQISNKIKFFLVAKNIDFETYINDKLQKFEEYSKDFMKDNGYYDGEKLTKILTAQFPILQGIAIADIKPIDLFVMLDELIGLEQLGSFIRDL